MVNQTTESDTRRLHSKEKPSRAELKAKRVDELLDSCRDQVLQQIIGPFGLTPAMFDDKIGGNVTTQHNAEQNIYAKEEEKYNRKEGDYDYSTAKKEIKQTAVKEGVMSSGTFTDTYTGNVEPTKRAGETENSL